MAGLDESVSAFEYSFYTEKWNEIEKNVNDDFRGGEPTKM